jgi:hypothetical protein
MSNPKEKARELYSKYCNFASFWMDKNDAKQCALIAVNLAIEYNDFHIEFLQEVKQEIEKL